MLSKLSVLAEPSRRRRLRLNLQLGRAQDPILRTIRMTGGLWVIVVFTPACHATIWVWDGRAPTGWGELVATFSPVVLFQDDEVPPLVA